MNGPFPHSTSEEATALHLKLHGNGYHPVPVNGKRPVMDEWQTVCLNAGPEEIARWVSKRDHLSTGILGGDIVGVDLDVLDDALSAMLEARVEELFGRSTLRRIGRAPKVLLVYRVAAPIKRYRRRL